MSLKLCIILKHCWVPIKGFLFLEFLHFFAFSAFLKLT